MRGQSFKKLTKCIVETIAVDLIILFAFWEINPIEEEFIGMNMHPFVIVSAAMALRYGSYIGIMSASVTSLIFIYAYSLLGRDMYIFFVDFDNYKFLVMFFLSAVVLGRFKDNYTYNIENSSENLKIMQKKYKELEKLYEKNRFINSQLKKQIVDSENSIISLYEIASSLDSLDPEEIYTQTMGIMSRFIGAKTVSIYTINGKNDFLRLKLRMGEGSELPNSIDINGMPCAQKIIGEKKPVKFNHTDECVGRLPLMSAPIVYEDRVIALINLEDAQFNMITDYSYYLFRLISEWINKALAQAIMIEGRINKGKYHEDTRIMKYNDFRDRLEEEKKRKLRFGLEYSLFRFKKSDQDIVQMDREISNLLRNVDVLGYDEDGGDFYILLPATPAKVAHIVEQRLEKGLGLELEWLE